MTLLKIYESEQTNEFRSFLQELKPNIERYSKAKHTAQIERMMIIGKINEYRQSFPQRSSDHRELSKAMTNEGWSKDVIYQNQLAYIFYKEILSHDKSWHPIAKKASVSQLLVLAQDKENKISHYHLIKYIRRNKGLPPVSALRGYAGGFFDEQFLPLSRHRTDWSRKTNKEKTASLEVQVVADDPTSMKEEVIQKTEIELIEELVAVVQKLEGALDVVYGDEKLRAKLEVVRKPLMNLAHLAIPMPSKPTYV